MEQVLQSKLSINDKKESSKDESSQRSHSHGRGHDRGRGQVGAYGHSRGHGDYKILRKAKKIMEEEDKVVEAEDMIKVKFKVTIATSLDITLLSATLIYLIKFIKKPIIARRKMMEMTCFL